MWSDNKINMVYNYTACFFKKKKKTLIIILVGFVLMCYTVNVLANGFLVELFHERECVDHCDFFSEGNVTKNSWKLDFHNFHSSAFQNVTRKGDSLVFSAYIDKLNSVRKIRAIGMKGLATTHDVYCLLWFKSTLAPGKINELYTISAGYIDPHPENFDRRWEAVHFMCSIPENTRPDAVSIVTNLHEQPRNFLWITDSKSNKFSQFTVCLHSPFDFKDDRSHEIVEWVELNKLLGADRFVFYNYSSHPKSDAIFNLYQRNALVDVVQWRLPEQADIHYLGQVASMTDCLYRNFHSSKYIVYLDLDEFIIPRRESIHNWSDLLQVQPKRCAYILRCTVFPVSDGYKESQFEGKDTAIKYKLNTLLVQTRQDYIFGSKDRSKFILQTDCMEVVGVHLLQKYRTSKPSEMTIDPGDALLHHYREGYPLFVRRGASLVDSYMTRFAKDLISNVEKTWNMLG